MMPPRIQRRYLRRGEYEYVFTIEREDASTLVNALDGPPGGYVLQLQSQGSRLVNVGEMQWLKAKSIPFDCFAP